MTAPSPLGHDPSRGLAMLATALGPSIAAMLDASDTIEVIANPDGRLWLEQVGKGRDPDDASAGWRRDRTRHPARRNADWRRGHARQADHLRRAAATWRAVRGRPAPRFPRTMLRDPQTSGPDLLAR